MHEKINAKQIQKI